MGHPVSKTLLCFKGNLYILDRISNLKLTQVNAQIQTELGKDFRGLFFFLAGKLFIYKELCNLSQNGCCLQCNHCSKWTWVVEEIFAFGNRLRSTHCGILFYHL